jgi:hypothetical protein
MEENESGKELPQDVSLSTSLDVDPVYAEKIMSDVKHEEELPQDSEGEIDRIRRAILGKIAGVDKEFEAPPVLPDLEGDPTLALFDRVNNPDIQKQRLELLLANEQAMADERIQYEKTVFAEDGLPEEDEEGNPKTVWVDEPKYPGYTPKTMEELTAEMNERVTEVTQLGGEKNVVYLQPEDLVDRGSHYNPTTGEVVVDRNEQLPDGGQNPQTLAITLAHEKGHELRPQGSSYLNKIFQAAIDMNRLVVGREEFEKAIADEPDEESREFMTMDKVNESIQEYFNSKEIMERMSQLKNYFGFHGNEPFTKAHLDYAREHYITDTGIDNRMSIFFRAITPEKEDAFIEAMNSLGV